MWDDILKRMEEDIIFGPTYTPGVYHGIPRDQVSWDSISMSKCPICQVISQDTKCCGQEKKIPGTYGSIERSLEPIKWR